jgi:hypothetical protein
MPLVIKTLTEIQWPRKAKEGDLNTFPIIWVVQLREEARYSFDKLLSFKTCYTLEQT